MATIMFVDDEAGIRNSLKRLFADCIVTKNDHIRGHLSGLDREIDVSDARR